MLALLAIIQKSSHVRDCVARQKKEQMCQLDFSTEVTATNHQYGKNADHSGHLSRPDALVKEQKSVHGCAAAD